ncbi:MAG: hypothetical protein M1814_002921 [Vezdaea aestivalis]|nr:MAG: hypothetical protein M1814_002921 [Vezdaea aestivalis]
MSDQISILRRARELRIHGRYADAVCFLEKALEKSSVPELAVELGETLLVQGYCARAIAVVDKFPIPSGPSNVLLAILARIIHSLAQTLVSKELLEPLRKAETAYALFLSSPLGGEVNDTTIRITAYYCKLRNLVASCTGENDTSPQQELLSKLETAFDILMAQKDFENVMQVVWTYNACHKGGKKELLARQLASNKQANGLQRAQAEFLLAKSLTSIEKRQDQEYLYESAEQLFEAANRAHGVLDIKIARLCRLPIDSEDNRFEEKLTDFFHRYEALDYPIGLANALTQLLDVGQQLSYLPVVTMALEALEALSIETSATLLWVQVRLSALARYNVLGSNRGKVIQGGTALWSELGGSDCKLFRGQSAQLVCIAYIQLRDTQNALLWNQRALQDLGEQARLDEIPILMSGPSLRTVQGLTLRYHSISLDIDPHQAGYSLEAATDILEAFVREALSHPQREQAAFAIIDSALEELETCVSRNEETDASLTRKAKLRESQASVLMFKSSGRLDIDFDLAAVKPLNEARDIYLQIGQMGSAVLVVQRMALLNLGIAQKFETTNDDQAQLAWKTAWDQYSVALDAANRLGLTFVETECAYWVAYCEYRQWIRGWCLLATVIQSLLKADAHVDMERREISTLRGVEVAIAKRRLSSRANTRNIYLLSIKLLIAIKDVHDAWAWVQKSKARSLSDVLGLGILIPKALMESILNSPDSRKLFEEESEIATRLQQASENERFRERFRLENHQKEMRKQPVLSELLDLREGVPVTMNELFKSSPDNGNKNTNLPSTLFVDWVILDSRLSVFVARKGEPPVTIQLSITMGSVQSWVMEHMNKGSEVDSDGEPLTTFPGMREEDDEDEGPLRELDVLIAPLESLSRPEDLLVLCPTGVLHSLPLHALRLGAEEDQKVLIERNPVVYGASLTSFAQCCRRAESSVIDRPQKHFLAVYEQAALPSDQFTECNEVQQQEIYASNTFLSNQFKGQAFQGEDVTVGRLQSSLENADWVHFLGHCDYSQELITDQSLVVVGERDSNNEMRPGVVTVKDLFDIRIKPSHITMLACASAGQEFQGGDEPLGLVTALLSAGATSVLGTSWPVESSAARLFSERFYHHLPRFTKDVGGFTGYDLACTMREAVLDVRQRRDFRYPYHWASFVLHGAWFCKAFSEPEG